MIYQFLLLLGTHWFADFVLQTHWQATNKSKNVHALLNHVLVYTSTLAVLSALIFYHNSVLTIFAFVIVNGVLHFWTDFFTSKLTSKLYANKDFHNFFAVIGFDQLIHQTTLALTMIYFLNV